MANANQTYCCGSYILTKSLKKHLTTAKHADFYNRIRTIRNTLNNRLPDNTPVNQKTYQMDIEFLTQSIFPRINYKLVKTTVAVKHILKTDCENEELNYYAITRSTGLRRYDEDIYITNGEYCIKVAFKDIAVDSPHDFERTEMPDRQDEYDDDEDDGYGKYVDDENAVPLPNLLEVNAFIRDAMKDCFQDNKDEDLKYESLYFNFGHNMDFYSYERFFFYFNRECKKDCRDLLVEGCRKLVDDVGMDEQDFEDFDFWKLAISYAELYAMMNYLEVHDEIIEQQTKENKEMFNEVLKQIVKRS